MIRYYGLKRYEVFSSINKNGSKPTETIIEFYIDGIRNLDMKRLNKIVECYIKNVNNFFVAVDGNKITIHIDYYRQVGLFDFDFELFKN
jgi:hypothetical protein